MASAYKKAAFRQYLQSRNLNPKNEEELANYVNDFEKNVWGKNPKSERKTAPQTQNNRQISRNRQYGTMFFGKPVQAVQTQNTFNRALPKKMQTVPNNAVSTATTQASQKEDRQLQDKKEAFLEYLRANNLNPQSEAELASMASDFKTDVWNRPQKQQETPYTIRTQLQPISSGRGYGTQFQGTPQGTVAKQQTDHAQNRQYGSMFMQKPLAPASDTAQLHTELNEAQKKYTAELAEKVLARTKETAGENSERYQTIQRNLQAGHNIIDLDPLTGYVLTEKNQKTAEQRMKEWEVTATPTTEKSTYADERLKFAQDIAEGNGYEAREVAKQRALEVGKKLADQNPEKKVWYEALKKNLDAGYAIDQIDIQTGELLKPSQTMQPGKDQYANLADWYQYLDLPRFYDYNYTESLGQQAGNKIAGGYQRTAADMANAMQADKEKIRLNQADKNDPFLEVQYIRENPQAYYPMIAEKIIEYKAGGLTDPRKDELIALIESGVKPENIMKTQTGYIDKTKYKLNRTDTASNINSYVDVLATLGVTDAAVELAAETDEGTQQAQQAYKEALTGNTFVDTYVTPAAAEGLAMLPNVAVSMVPGGKGARLTGKILTTINSTVRGYGAGAEQARGEGATRSQQILQGAASAAAEAVTERIALDKIFKVSDTILERNFKNAAKRIGVSMLTEGSTEALSDVLQNASAKYIYKPDMEWFSTDKEEDAVINIPQLFDTFVISAALGGGMGAGNYIGQARYENAAHKATQDLINNPQAIADGFDFQTGATAQNARAVIFTDQKGNIGTVCNEQGQIMVFAPEEAARIKKLQKEGGSAQVRDVDISQADTVQAAYQYKLFRESDGAEDFLSKLLVDNGQALYNETRGDANGEETALRAGLQTAQDGETDGGRFALVETDGRVGNQAGEEAQQDSGISGRRHEYLVVNSDGEETALRAGLQTAQDGETDENGSGFVSEYNQDSPEASYPIGADSRTVEPISGYETGTRADNSVRGTAMDGRREYSGDIGRMGLRERAQGAGARTYGLRQEVNGEAQHHLDRGSSIRDTVVNRPAIQRALAENNITPVELKSVTDSNAFSNAILEAKQSNDHGAFVTAYSPEEYDTKKLFLSDDGYAGVAVTDDGDIESVFKNSGSKAKGAVSSLILTAIDNGGIKLDNYDSEDLSLKYEAHGFIPVAKVKFDPRYAPDDWNYDIAREDGQQPDIVFWIHNGDLPETVAQKIGDYDAVDTSNIPVFDTYDQAQRYRDMMIGDVQRRRRQARQTSAQAQEQPTISMETTDTKGNAQRPEVKKGYAVRPTPRGEVRFKQASETVMNNLSRADVKRVREVEKLAKDLGLPERGVKLQWDADIEVYDGADVFADNGFYDSKEKVLHISLDAENGAYRAVLLHEMSHMLEGTAAYRQIQTIAVQRLKEAGVYESMMREYGELYGADEQTYIEQEIVADEVARICNEPAYARVVARGNRGIINKLLNALDTIKARHRLGKEAAAQFESLRTLLQNALEENADNSTAIKHSKKLGGYFPDVEVSTDGIASYFGIRDIRQKNQVINKVAAKLADSYLSTAEQSKPITNIDTGMKVEIRKSGIRETFGNDKYYLDLSDDLKLAKIASMKELAKLIKYGEVRAPEASNYHNPNSPARYAYLIAPLRIDGVDYDVTMDIRRIDKGDRFYIHKLNIKEGRKDTSKPQRGLINDWQALSSPERSAAGIKSSQALHTDRSSLSTRTVAQEGADVNSIRRGTENDTTGAIKHQIKRDQNGRPYVLIEQNLFEGHEGEKQYKVVENYLKSNVGLAATLAESGQAVYLGKDLPGEYVHSKYTQSLSVPRNKEKLFAKYQAAQNLDEMIEIADNRKWRKNQKERHKEDAKYGWYRYNVRFALPTSFDGTTTEAYMYTAHLIIRNAENGKKYLYDVIDIERKKKKFQYMATHGSSNAAAGPVGLIRSALPDTSSLSTRTVAQEGADVNSIRRGTENDTLRESRKRSKLVDTVQQSEAVSQETKDSIEVLKESGFGMYDVKSNRDSVERARAKLDTFQTDEQAQAHIARMSDEGKRLSAEDVAFCVLAVNRAGQNGHAEMAQKMIADMRIAITDQAQAIQAAGIFKKMDKTGRLYALEKTRDRLNEQIRKNGGKTKVSLAPHIVQELMDASTRKEGEAIEKAALTDMAGQVPAKLADKLTAWRYMSMLSNPRTHIRNITGNVLMYAAVSSKNIAGALMEGAAAKFNPNMERTKTLQSLHTSKGRDALAFAKQDAQNQYEFLTNDGKEGARTTLNEGQRIFKNRVLEFIRDKNGDFLEKEDAFFITRQYQNALAKYMLANGLSASDLQNSPAKYARARDYAANEAWKATFHDASKLAAALNKFEKSGPAAKLIVGGVMPFKKTPINVLKRGVEYSPLGLIDGLMRGSVALKQGKINANEYIDRISAGLTGTMVSALGAFLASIGVLRASGADNDDEEYFERMRGEQPYSLRIGGMSFTIDWAAPICIPLFVGCEAFNVASKQDNAGAAIPRIIDAFANASDPMLQLSCLQGVNDAIDSFSKKDALGALGSFASTTAANYISQFIPTIFGQTARTIDPTRRTTYAAKDSAITQGAEKFLRKLANKIPFLNSTLQPYVDQWGNLDTGTKNIVVRSFEQYLFPWYQNEIEENDTVNREIERLYANTGDASVLPKMPSSTIQIGKENEYVPSEHIANYQKVYGEKARSVVQSLMSSSIYRGMDDSERVEAIASAYTYAKEYAKQNGSKLPYKITNSWVLNAMDAEKRGIPIATYILVRQQGNDIEGVKDKNGQTINGTKKANRVRYLNTLPLTTQQKQYILTNMWNYK